mgnify:CR=1 FL=1
MKKSIYFVLVLVCGGITALSAIHLQKKTSVNNLFIENVEALTDSEGGTGGCGGFRSWSISGFLSSKKEFYDCKCILRQGYKPQGTC